MKATHHKHKMRLLRKARCCSTFDLSTPGIDCDLLASYLTLEAWVWHSHKQVVSIAHVGLQPVCREDTAELEISQKHFSTPAGRPECCLFVQPMDAIAAIVDGGLLGASDTAYVAKTMLVTSALSFGALLLAQRLQGGLLGIWLALKVITTGRVIGGALRLASRKTSPLQKPPKVVQA